MFDLAGAGIGSGGWPESGTSFATWYRTSPTLVADGNIEVVRELALTRPDDGNCPNRYEFSSDSFFPLDDEGWELADPFRSKSSP